MAQPAGGLGAGMGAARARAHNACRATGAASAQEALARSQRTLQHRASELQSEAGHVSPALAAGR